MQLDSCEEETQNLCIEKYFASTLYRKLKKFRNHLIDERERLGKTHISNFKQDCSDGMRLGYVRKKKGTCTYCAFTDRVDRTKLYGEFETVDKCDEARLLDSDNYDTSKGCYWRYIKENKSINVFKATAMKNSNKLIVRFKNNAKCQKSVKNGFKLYDHDQRVKIPIGALGSKSKNRFIKGCEPETVLLCEKYKEDGSSVHFRGNTLR